MFADSQAPVSPEGPVTLSPQDWWPLGREPLPGSSELTQSLWASIRAAESWAAGEKGRLLPSPLECITTAAGNALRPLAGKLVIMEILSDPGWSFPYLEEPSAVLFPPGTEGQSC